MMIPSPCTLFDDERSLIFIRLGLYVIKSDRRGEMQTEAPESTINMVSVELRRKHLGSSRVERNALNEGIFVVLRSIES